jgi:hypothetical protein
LRKIKEILQLKLECGISELIEPMGTMKVGKDNFINIVLLHFVEQYNFGLVILVLAPFKVFFFWYEL